MQYPAIGRMVFVAALAAAPLVLNTYWINLLTLALIYSLAVYSINLLTGFTGLLSFGQAAFVGLGAYAYGVLSVAGMSPETCGWIRNRCNRSEARRRPASHPVPSRILAN